MGASISIEGVHKGYGAGRARTAIFEGLDLAVPADQVLAVFGGNGSGKSTLLRMLAGLTLPDAGRVSTMGVSGGPAKVGYVFQAYDQSLMPWLSCLDNIALPLVSVGWRRDEARAEARSLLAALEADLPVDRYPYQMSGGQKQLAVIARALVIQPDLLLLDEPLASLDHVNRLKTLKTLERRWRQKPTTTVFVSHDVDEAIFLSDRVLVFGGSPTAIVDSVEVHLPRPRDIDVISSREFGALRDRVLRPFFEPTP